MPRSVECPNCGRGFVVNRRGRCRCGAVLLDPPKNHEWVPSHVRVYWRDAPDAPWSLLERDGVKPPLIFPTGRRRPDA